MNKLQLVHCKAGNPDLIISQYSLKLINICYLLKRSKVYNASRLTRIIHRKVHETCKLLIIRVKSFSFLYFFKNRQKQC